jgi:opacity protein-like surface antigen
MTNYSLLNLNLVDMHREPLAALTLTRELNVKIISLIELAIATALILTLPLAQASDWTGNVGGSIGSKNLDDDDWSSLDNMESVGFLFDIKKRGWPVSLTYDLIASGDTRTRGDTKGEAYTLENQFGIRKTFTLTDSNMRPYIGGGVTLISAEIKNKTAGVSTRDDDDATGFWLGAGWYVGVTDNVDIGFDVRYSQAEVTIFDQDREAGGFHYAANASYHW